MQTTRAVTITLGIAGLIPFVLPAILMLAGSELAIAADRFAQIYAFAIVCFLCGCWWGMSLLSGKRYPFVLSNLYLLVAFFVFSLTPSWWPVAAPLLLIGIFVVELNRNLFPVLPPFYRYLRAALTLVSASSMFLILLLRPS